MTNVDALHAAGQRPPAALALHAQLAARGVLPPGAAPRSVDAVLDALRALPLHPLKERTL